MLNELLNVIDRRRDLFLHLSTELEVQESLLDELDQGRRMLDYHRISRYQKRECRIAEEKWVYDSKWREQFLFVIRTDQALQLPHRQIFEKKKKNQNSIETLLFLKTESSRTKAAMS
ncbi:hypothetical protein PGT21_007959 [Puccinia graminis f. sp. tritici]|uniref:Uncharacterized protein n=1 Tax=Puccinia graminis f. sp. tritici TaxID=56615 RepID=A0A5B0Q289_PUCGR|nr:hypothetical protein PGT21_007959 [Puccinia graminis f. sp. tritici]KAA1124935.1 hypothetical protein PGTUg99_036921 [Puccinia graminis f. sp. tritici]